MTSVFKFVIKCEILGLEENVLGMFSPKFVNMPLMMKFFVRALNMFSSSFSM